MLNLAQKLKWIYGWMGLMQISSLKWHYHFMWMIVLTKMALWIYMKKWIDLDEGRDSIYRPRGRGMDGQNARMSESLWRARMS